MMETRYHYSATLKPTDATLEDLPTEQLNEIVFNSRRFTNFEDCTFSCRSLMEGYAKKLNGDDERFKVGSEINPVHTGTPTLSKDWGLNETARIWVYDKQMEGTGTINAMGQARIFTTSEYVTGQSSLS